MIPNAPCCICADPAVAAMRGFEWCERHFINLMAVLRGDLALPARSPGAAPLPRLNGRIRRHVSAVAKRQADALRVLKQSPRPLKIRDVADALGIPVVQARTALWQLRRRGKAKAEPVRCTYGGYRGRPQKLWRAA